MRVSKYILSLIFLIILNLEIMAQDKLSYLALGDSYTIGEAVDPDGRWPEILSKNLRQRGLDIEVKKVVARTGWTTDELLHAMEADDSLNTSTFDVVSLLIGVNNQYRGYGIKQYEREFEELLKKAVNLAGRKTNRVFVVSIPDYGVTPFAKENDKNGAIIAKELHEYNRVAKNIADEYGVRFFDITPISLKAIWEEDYVAKDKLHPSAKMYAEWAQYIEPGVFQLLRL